MIPANLSHVTLGVDDLHAQRRFYSELWTEKTVLDDYVAYDLGGPTLALFPRSLLDAEAHVDAGSRGGFTLAVLVGARTGVDAALETARAAGATTWPAEQRDWGGYSGYFADPEGNRWEIAWAPPPDQEDQ